MGANRLISLERSVVARLKIPVIEVAGVFLVVYLREHSVTRHLIVIGLERET